MATSATIAKKTATEALPSDSFSMTSEEVLTPHEEIPPEPVSPSSASSSEVGSKETSSPPKVRLASLLRGPFDVRSISLTGLFILAALYTMYFTRGILLPIVLALLLSQLLAPFVRALAGWHIPQMIGSGLILLFLCGTFVFAVSFLTEPARGWLEKAPYGLHQLQAKLVPLMQRPMQKVAEASGEVEKLANAANASTPQKKNVVEVQQHGVLLSVLFDRTPDIVASLVTLLILLYFLLGYNGVFLNKLVKVIPRFHDKKLAVKIASDIETKISSYLLTVTLINTGLGCAIALSMYFLGLPNPIMWGVAAAVLNFVPYLGAFTGILAMTIAALLSYDNVGYALLFPGVYLLLTTIEGNIITPMLLGRSLTLNPVAIIISLMFWGWMWGVIGVILAVPLLATFKILCDHIEPLAPMGEFLSD